MEKVIKVPFKFGMHVRPAVKLAELSQKYRCNIFIEKDNQKANAKSPIEVISLAIMPQSVVKIIAQGEDAKEAITSITNFFSEFKDNY